MKKVATYFTVLLVSGGMMASSFKQHKAISSSQQTDLGRLFFFDTRLSTNNTTSCASCHMPQFAFADTFITPKGAFGDEVKRNTPTLINLSDNKLFNWAHPTINSLQQQANIPLFGLQPIEMGMDSNNLNDLEFIFKDEKYSTILKDNNAVVNWSFVKDAIAAYVNTFNFYNSKYDNYLAHKVKFTSQEKRGMKLFFSEELKCKRCHGGKDFDAPSNPKMYIYQNIGLYNIGAKNWYGNSDNGAFDVNKDTTDIGRFKIPTLRNITVTAPYFHDGTASNLEAVITHYKNGGRQINEGINKGNGAEHPNKHPSVGGFEITTKQTQELIAFLSTLTDTSYLKNINYQNPFK